MNKSTASSNLKGRFGSKLVILTFSDLDHPPEPIVQLPMSERFQIVPTRSILMYLDMGEMVSEAREAALAELARRGVPPPVA